MNIPQKVPQIDGECTGCVFYRSNPRKIGMSIGRRWCINGSAHAPSECAEQKIIYKYPQFTFKLVHIHHG